MNYEESIHYLNSFINFERLPERQFTTREEDLDRLKLILDKLGNPQQNYPIIHIAGTKGKGSTAIVLGSILKSAGYKVGVYTSPHLLSVRERIRTNGYSIVKIDFARSIRYVKQAIEMINGPLAASYRTLFEILTAAMFAHFSLKKIDVAVIEAGLGGKLDATNIVEPILSIITPVGLDHTAILGETISEIAADKAHIIKAGVPAVTAQQDENALTEIKKRANEVSAKLTIAPPSNELFDRIEYDFEQYFCKLIAVRKEKVFATLQSVGKYQADNLATALTAVEQLRISGFKIPLEACIEGFRSSRMRGRMQYIKSNPPIILDGAHNDMAMKSVRESIDGITPAPLRVVISSMKSKPLHRMIRSLADRTVKFYLAPICFPKSKDESELREAAEEADVSFQLYSDVPTAFEAAKREAEREELILATGSFYLIGEILRHRSGKPKPPETGVIDHRI